MGVRRLNRSDVTAEADYRIWETNRRSLLTGLGAVAVGGLLLRPARAAAPDPTPEDYVTGYNNFYEFGPSKDDPAQNAGSLTTSPWSVTIDGLVERPGTFALADVIPSRQDERIYRLRCVEGWSMVIPWTGFPLARLLEQAAPLAEARYVAFETVVRPDEMPGQRGLFQPLPWPYREGLRLDEAMHPLALLATGLYGKPLPNQNGAPIRLVVPWKYGFKSAKSIVRISLVKDQPPTTWQTQAPREYGFYANVNPAVDHPRWSQATERIIGGGLFGAVRDTEPFNGYGDEVASLYAGMDLAKFY